MLDSAQEGFVVAVGVVTMLIYIPIFVFLWYKVRKQRLVREFNHALNLVFSEVSTPDPQTKAIDKLETFFRQSDLNRHFKNLVDVMEHLHQLVYSGRMTFSDKEESEAFNSLLSAMRANKPFSSLSGEWRRLIEAVALAMPKDSSVGEHAIQQLADHIEVTDGRLDVQRRLNVVFGIFSTTGVVLTIAALVISILNLPA